MVFLFLITFAAFALFSLSVGEIASGQLCGQKGTYYNVDYSYRIYYLYRYDYQNTGSNLAKHLDECMKICNDDTQCRSVAFQTYSWSYEGYCELWSRPK